MTTVAIQTPATGAVGTSYDAVQYPGRPSRVSHPHNLAAVAALYGLEPPPVRGCRVLELGCGSGANLIPLAFSIPDAELVGFDISSRQVMPGKALVDALGLDNVRLFVRDLREGTSDLGQFDYIICHGVYSWVPPEAQHAILRTCARNLAPGGLAYVSYNTYPGWHAAGMLRDMLMFHDDPTLDPAERVQRARAFAELVASSALSEERVFRQVLRAECDVLARQTDWHLVHEQLEDHNEPVYFSEFARRAAAEGLEHVADAMMVPADSAIEEQSAEALATFPSDRLRREQCVDFLLNRRFRRSILCHAGRDVSPRALSTALRGMHLRARVQEKSMGPDENGARSFRSPEGVWLTTNRPLVLGSLQALLRAWPGSLAFPELLGEVEAWVRNSSHPDVARLEVDSGGSAAVLLPCVLAGLVQASAAAPGYASHAGERPVASPLARRQAIQSSEVASLSHESVDLGKVERLLLPLLDGTRDRRQLRACLQRAVDDGSLAIPEAPPEARADAGRAVDPVLDRFAELGLLLS